MYIRKAVIVMDNNHPDKIYLETDLPSAIEGHAKNLFLTLSATAGTGEQYIKDNFNVPKENIDVVHVPPI